MSKNKMTRHEMNEFAIEIRNAVFKKFRLPVMGYFARFSCTCPDPEFVHAFLIIKTSFFVTEASNIKSAKAWLVALSDLVKNIDGISAK